MYIAICTWKDQTFVRETSILDRKMMIEYIATGEIEDIVQIINVNLEKGTSKDDTESIAFDVWCYHDSLNEEPTTYVDKWLRSWGHDTEHLGQPLEPFYDKD